MSVDNVSERPGGVATFSNRRKIVQHSNSDNCARCAMSIEIPRNSKFLSGHADLKTTKEHIGRSVRPVLPCYLPPPTNIADSDITASQNMGNRMSR